ncbi:50S ribosomal protein L6 [Candidatus Blochmannia ocreatus (nom. nud.)]|uniref:50S ribosomal protein L6 n=1 Tax=Candidatus Blochmannia ocreatus (nom. nud.) TaxID=251538 RepID=A0ABY4SUX1_9ENTR|nr:50S ribosomal protein L6 [Candidatus Blochmannia ocreatus]URJ25283.1 50S ribosomal protein L6 [Candidatus Blochmannia ocreatus]
MFYNIKNNTELRTYNIVIPTPNNLTIKLKNCSIFITGVLGTLQHTLNKSVSIKLDEKKNILLCTKQTNYKNKALIGTTRAIINNMIIGVETGFSKTLQLTGIGYRVTIENNIVKLLVGLSHAINYKLPIGIIATCPNTTEITLKGINKQLVGQTAANLRALRPPEPFKGKGIRYSDEIVYNKDTKKR